LNVSERDQATGKAQKVTITPSSGLSKQDIDRMVAEAERHAAEDRQRKEEIEERNRADQLVYTADRTLQDFGARVPGELRMSIENQAQDLRQAIKENNLSRIRTLSAQLQRELQRVGQAVKEAAAASTGAGASGAAYGPPPGYGSGYGGAPGQPGPETYPTGEEGPVEGEFREV